MNLNIKYSRNNRWIQLYGVPKTATWLHSLLRSNGWKWCNRAHRWWNSNTQRNRDMAANWVVNANQEEPRAEERETPKELPSTPKVEPATIGDPGAQRFANLDLD